MAAFPVISVGLCLLIASTHGVRSPVAGGIQVVLVFQGQKLGVDATSVVLGGKYGGSSPSGLYLS
eukprot:1321061-Amorphochlora_amoeboformis.AAC.1